ncbi:hypothetical protein [Allosalinactinospora lopnorensis]|nr:hypothetical protein [Allosalinactinospora lopnorensis]
MTSRLFVVPFSMALAAPGLAPGPAASVAPRRRRFRAGRSQ